MPLQSLIDKTKNTQRIVRSPPKGRVFGTDDPNTAVSVKRTSRITLSIKNEMLIREGLKSVSVNDFMRAGRKQKTYPTKLPDTVTDGAAAAIETAAPAAEPVSNSQAESVSPIAEPENSAATLETRIESELESTSAVELQTTSKSSNSTAIDSSSLLAGIKAEKLPAKATMRPSTEMDNVSNWMEYIAPDGESVLDILNHDSDDANDLSCEQPLDDDIAFIDEWKWEWDCHDFSILKQEQRQDIDEKDEDSQCICGSNSASTNEDWVQCDNKKCKIGWYHYTCGNYFEIDWLNEMKYKQHEYSVALAEYLIKRRPYYCPKCFDTNAMARKCMSKWKDHYKSLIKRTERKIEFMQRKTNVPKASKKSCPYDGCQFTVKLLAKGDTLKKGKRMSWGSSKLLDHYERKHAPSFAELRRSGTVYFCNGDKSGKKKCIFITFEQELLKIHLVCYFLIKHLSIEPCLKSVFHMPVMSDISHIVERTFITNTSTDHNF